MQFLQTSLPTQRALLWLGLGMATVFFVAFAFLLGFLPVPAADLRPEQIVPLYADSNLKFRLGVMLMILTAAFFMPWSLVVAVQMARIGKHATLWALLQAFACTGSVWTLALPPVLWGAAAFNVQRDPALTVLMHELSWLVFVTPVSLFPFQLIPVAVVSLSRHNTGADTAFPRWVGWLSLFVGVVASEGFVAVGFNKGIFSWAGIFSFYVPVALVGAWVTAVSVTMLRAIRLQAAALPADRHASARQP